MATRQVNAGLRLQEHDPAVFQQLEDYAWDSDSEFQSGLQAILGLHPSAEQVQHFTLRARCFYFARYGIRKNNTQIDFDAYQTWRSQQSSSRANNISLLPSASSPSSMSNSPSNINPTSRNCIDTTSGNIEATAPYPTSFSQIVELITSGDPIPGIKEIPDTVMEGQASQSTTAKRRKPWENDGAGAAEEFVVAKSSVPNIA